MPAPVPLLLLSALGITGLVLTATSKAGAKTGNQAGNVPLGSGSSAASGKPPSTAQEADDMPLDLKKSIAKAIADLTIDAESIRTAADGTVTAATIIGPVTKDAVQGATALAAELDRKGFPIAGKTMRDLANLASKRIPDPPKDAQIPLPPQCFTADEQKSLTRAAELERDPAKLQAIIDALTAKLAQAPAPCVQQIKDAVDLIRAVMQQAIAKAAEDEALKKTQEILSSAAPPAAPVATTPVVAPPATKPPVTTSARVVVVQKGEGFANITRRLLGADTRWRELRDANLPNDADGRTRKKDTDAKGGISPILQPGQKLFVPSSWPAMPSVTVDAPVAAPPPAAAPTAPAAPVLTSSPAPATGSGPAIVTVHSGEGLSNIAVRLLGQSQGLAKWKELRARNIPTDAMGKARKVAADGNFSPPQQPGDRLFVPESWPIAPGTVIGYAPEETPVEMVSPKSDLELAAFSMCEQLVRCQARRPETLGRGAEDKKKILRFRHKAGMAIAPNVTPEVLVRAAECGVCSLPLVMHWPPDATLETVVEYRSALLGLAKQAAEEGNLSRAEELAASARRERGQAAGIEATEEA